MDKIRIKKATLSDLDLLLTISKQTFIETFAALNTKENMENYVRENFNFKQLTKELKDPECFFFLATLDDTVIGYLKINFGKAQTELNKEHALEIHRIYVLQEFHGKKVGQLLIDEVSKIAQQQAAPYIWLGVWEENHRALRFYAKNEFVAFDKHVFTLGTATQTDLLLKRQIKNIVS